MKKIRGFFLLAVAAAAVVFAISCTEDIESSCEVLGTCGNGGSGKGFLFSVRCVKD